MDAFEAWEGRGICVCVYIYISIFEDGIFKKYNYLWLGMGC